MGDAKPDKLKDMARAALYSVMSIVDCPHTVEKFRLHSLKLPIAATEVLGFFNTRVV